jgi:predicted enzyme related to lactoylglutathione lyase
MTGQPSYIELGVADPDKARAFYGSLLGWQPSGDSGGGQVDTSTLSIGIHGGDDSRHFEVFFTVGDLEQSLKILTQVGGGTVSEINTSPGFGRWIECVDDQGVRFGIRQTD